LNLDVVVETSFGIMGGVSILNNLENVVQCSYDTCYFLKINVLPGHLVGNAADLSVN